MILTKTFLLQQYKKAVVEYKKELRRDQHSNMTQYTEGYADALKDLLTTIDKDSSK